MKKLSILILILVSVFSFSFAQGNDPGKREKIMKEVLEHKMKYLAQEIGLNDDQKTKFYELYEEMSESKRECFSQAVMMDRKLRGNTNATEEEYQQVRNEFNVANIKWMEIEKEYDNKFSEFLTQKQIYKMKEAEQSYRMRKEEMKHNRRRDHHKKSEE